MFLRKMRWLCAAVVAILAAAATPARSMADTVIQITELGGATTTFSSGSSTGSFTTPSFSTTNYQNITVTINPNMGVPGFSIGSLTSTVNAVILNGFDPSSTLQVVVTSAPEFTAGVPGFANNNPGQPANFLNSASNSSAIFGASTNATGTTELLNLPGAALNASAPAASSSVHSVAGETNLTTGASPSLPDLFAIRQTITVRVTPLGGSISPGTLGATSSSNVLSNAAPVPAPAGLLLALAAAPVLGLRRILRRKTA